jgi:hypothetical protein
LVPTGAISSARASVGATNNGYSFTISATDGAQWAQVNSIVGSFQPGSYTFSLVADWSEDNDILSRFFYKIGGGAEVLIGALNATLNPDKKMKRYSASFFLPVECNRLSIRLWTGSNPWPIGSSFSILMAQVEPLPLATSYIPTNGSAATRAADSASVLMQPHTSGTILCKFLSDAVAVERTVYTAGAITLKRLATGAISVTAGVVTLTSAVVPSGSVKSAISYDGSTLKLAVNGVVYSAASALPAAGTSLVLGTSTFASVWQRSEAYDNARLIEVTQ